MAFAPHFQPHGGFNFDTSTRPNQPLHADVFRPPPSPTASSYNLAKSTGSLFSDISMSTAQHAGTAKRKRTSTRESTPLGWRMNMDSIADGREEERSREFRYTLAGQISTTPAAVPVGAENGLLEDSVYSDVDYRRALGPKAPPQPESPSEQAPANTPTNTPSLASWSIFSLQTIGDMVGKVWEFCKNGAFKGFHAGGGQGYDVSGSTVTATTVNPWVSDQNTPIQPAEDTAMTQEPPPYFPQPAQATYSPVYHDVGTPDSTPRPAAKRRQVSANNNDELKNWVVVDEEPSNHRPARFAAEVKAAAARPSGLARPRSGYYSQTSASSHRRISTPSQRFTGGTSTLPRPATRPGLRISHSGSPNLAPREPASFASPRASPVSHSTPSRIPVPIQSPVQQSHNPNPFAFPSTTTPATASSTTSSSSKPTLRTSASRPASRQSTHTTRQSLGGSTSLRPASPTKRLSLSTGPAHRRNQSSTSTISTSTTAAARRQSTLLARPPAELQAAAATSPRLDAEARQLAQRKLAAERDADARVDAFNAKLLSMIRQGREALGTKVEVEMGEEMDFLSGGAAGWEDDE